MNRPSLAARLDFALRGWRATKETRCSLATQYQYAKALDALIDEAHAELPGLVGTERAALERMLATAERELRMAVGETGTVVS